MRKNGSKKYDPTTYHVQETLFRTKSTCRLKRDEKAFHINNTQKRSRVAVVISDKIRL